MNMNVKAERDDVLSGHPRLSNKFRFGARAGEKDLLMVELR